MAEFVSTIAESVMAGLASFAYQEVCLAWGVEEELKRLRNTFSHIKLLIVDAEERQRKEPLLTQWLGRLKDACYDIDDVLDEFAFQEMQMKMLVPGGSIKGKVCIFFSRWNPIMFNFIMGHKIKEIRERLDDMGDEKSRFHLVERVGDWQVVHIKRETHSFVQPYDVIGREDDKKQVIIHLLNLNLKEASGGAPEHVSVISIIGLGGIGKTTLAKLVYNDHRVVRNFNMRMWVCVSDHFDHKRLVHDILTSATNQNCGDHESLDQMQKKLQDALRDKQFLLVLDDVWDKAHVGVTSSKWFDMKALLNVGAEGSKVIVTTRSESVASVMSSARVHQLKGLPFKVCKSLLIRRAFGQKGEEQRYQHLMEIAESIADKCGGVPLAVTTLGSLLHSKREKQVWSKVRDSDIWTLDQGNEDILPALKLSYDALPPYLKPCFAICSLFPKDYVFQSTDLVSLWMAQGFLQSSNPTRSKADQELEEIGLDYIRQLGSRFLFEIEEDSIDFIVFKMHNLVHDLAISVSKLECSSINFRPNPDTCKRVRHVSMSKDDLPTKKGERVPEFFLQLQKVWTILFPIPGHEGFSNKSVLKSCILKFKYLRVLDLRGSTFEELPGSVGNLSGLRYLNLSKNPSMQKLPGSICRLLNLQTLLLTNCEKLKKLPRDIGNLINLRTLVLTTNQTVMPEGIERLTSLRFLQVDSCSHLVSFGEMMQCLTNLRVLVISNCQSLETLPGDVENLTALKALAISDCVNLDLMRSGEGIRDLRSVSVSHLEALPPWLKESTDTLQSLSIKNCEGLKELPEWLQTFKLLEHLVIEYCPQLSSLPEGMHLLGALRELKIDGCSKLSERCKGKEGADWLKIVHVSKVTVDGEIVASNVD
ncbi:hypothetical protein EV1_015713 [Malus domestica]